MIKFPVKFLWNSENRWYMYKYIYKHRTTSREILDLQVRFCRKCSSWSKMNERTASWMPIAQDSKCRRRPNLSTMGTGDWNGKFLKIARRRCQNADVYGRFVRLRPESRDVAWHTSAVDRAPRRLRADFIGPIIRCSCELSRETKTWRSGFTLRNL